MSAETLFNSAFARAPLAQASAPGRVNLIGEHTDYNGGAVLPAAIERTVSVAIAPNRDDTYRIQSSRFEGLIERPAGDPKRGDWTDYAVGALTMAHRLGWLHGGADLAIDSDVPDGAGVSSSAALITAILRACAALTGVKADPVEIAKAARAVENDYIGMPCGIMDQMAVGLASPGMALALNTLDLSYEVVPIPEDWAFVVLHSGVRRELADGRYKRRFEECREAADALGAPHLCLLVARQKAAISDLPSALAKRARHVTSEHARTLAATNALKAADMEQFDRLMTESHRSYSEDFEASTPEIDALVADAVRLGAKGARLTGGGFGGCIVALLEAERVTDWQDQILAAHPNAWRV